MTKNSHSSEKQKRSTILPPRALLMSLVAQCPLMFWRWPPKLTIAALAIGTTLIVGGIVLNLWADSLFRRNGVEVCPFHTVRMLVWKGPFRLTRNPMYLGMVLISAGFSFLGGRPLNLIAAGVLALWLHFRYILPEEAFLRDRLGLDYLRYASAIPRWIGLPGPLLVLQDNGDTRMSSI